MRAFSYPDQSVQEVTSLNAVLENTLAVARSEYCNVADIETSFGEIPDVVCYVGEISHAGSISFETRQGQGTTFFVRLPIHGRAAAEPRHASATSA